MRSRPTLSTKLLAMGAGCLLVALASIGLTLWVTWKLEGGAAAVNEAGRLRMNMLRMVLVLQTEPPEAVQERAPVRRQPGAFAHGRPLAPAVCALERRDAHAV